MKRRSSSGVSLLEILLVAVIMTIVLVMTFSILKTGGDVADQGSVISDVETRARRCVDEVKQELMYAKIDFTVSPPNERFIKYQLPCRQDPTQFGYQDYLDPGDGKVKTNVGWYATIELSPVTANGQGQVWKEPNGPPPPAVFLGVASFNEEEARITLNYDKENNDTFVRMKLVKRVYNALGVQQAESAICDDYIIVSPKTSTTIGDTDGDNIDDKPLQYYNAAGTVLDPPDKSTKSVRILVWVGRFDMNHSKFFLRKNEQTIMLKNPQ